MSAPAIPVGTGPDEGEARWFLGTLGVIKIDGAQTEGRYSLMDFLLPAGAAPPAHTHPQDESFWVLEGELTAWIGGERMAAPAGSLVFAPGGTSHTWRVDSDGARVLTLSTPAGIEDFVRLLSVPATALTLPPADTPRPTADEIEAGFRATGAEILGPAPGPED